MKRRYVILDAIREVDYTTHAGSYTVSAQEIVEITSNIINVYTSDERCVNDEIVCNMNFMVRYDDGECSTLDWDLHCTVKQSRSNIAKIYEVLEDFRKEEEKEGINVPEPQNGDKYDAVFGPTEKANFDTMEEE